MFRVDSSDVVVASVQQLMDHFVTALVTLAGWNTLRIFFFFLDWRLNNSDIARNGLVYISICIRQRLISFSSSLSFSQSEVVNFCQDPIGGWKVVDVDIALIFRNRLSDCGLDGIDSSSVGPNFFSLHQNIDIFL